MLFFQVYREIWIMCAACLGFFMGVAALAITLRIPRWDIRLPSGPVLVTSALAWTLLMGILLTLIDKPNFNVSEETKDWLFMFSAFLGIPVVTPLLAWGVWALAHALRGESMRLGAFLLVGLAAFALGCAASNLHDLLWCGIFTNGYTEHYKAGYDLDLFVAFGRLFNIPEGVCADYATLGPYTAVLILGEWIVALGCWYRLTKSYRAPAQRAQE